MTTHEPYVADPQEPRPRPRLFRARPVITVAIVLLLAAAGAFLFLRDRAEQDPSLGPPDAIEAEPAPEA